MAFSLSDVTLALGNLAGNRGTPYAAGASAGVYDLLTSAQAKIKAKLDMAGAKIGPIIGSAIPEALAAGAARTGAPATSALETKLLGLSLPQLALYGALALAAGWYLWTRRAFSRR